MEATARSAITMEAGGEHTCGRSPSIKRRKGPPIVFNRLRTATVGGLWAEVPDRRNYALPHLKDLTYTSESSSYGRYVMTPD